MAWTDQKRAEVIAEYTQIMTEQFTDDTERAANSIEVVKQLATKHGESANGVRMILQKAEVYIKKEATTSTRAVKTGETGEAGAKRINKVEAIQDLKNAISAIDPQLLDDDILDKLTGKAAAYFASLLTMSKE